MGLLEQGQSAIAEAEAQQQMTLEQSRQAAISSIMAEMRDTLESPVFTGDPETALIHYMGAEAFEDPVATQRYTDLVKRIQQHGDQDVVPVLFITQDYDAMGDAYGESSSLIKVNPSAVGMDSTRTRQEDVKMNIFTDRTATVVHKQLALVGSTTIMEGNVLQSDKPLQGETVKTPAFVLSESHEAEGSVGKGMPSDYNFSDYGKEAFFGDPTILVGWTEIEEAFITHLAASSNNFAGANKIQDFFANAGELEAVKQHAPRIAEVIMAIESFKLSFDGLVADK